MKRTTSTLLAAGTVLLAATAVTLSVQTAFADASLSVVSPPAAALSHRVQTIEAKRAPVATPAPDEALQAQLDADKAAGKPASAADTEMLHGAYLARAGDCIACHTAKGGTPFAGGLPLASPIGTMYSTNITSDKAHGIGNWSYDDFAKLMRTGVTKAGYTVYPAMPYPSYSRLSDADMHALYVYFTQAVPPSAQANKENGIPWPLSMRWPMTFWRMFFAPEPKPFSATAGMDAETARGAYLVEGLGHCSSCHTPRAVTMQEKRLFDDDSHLFLSGGGPIDGWMAPSLRNEHGGGLAGWSQADIVSFLKTGRNEHTASFGAMNDVVVDSMQYMSDADLNAMAKYLKTLQPLHPEATAYRYDDKATAAALSGQPATAGATLYLDRCAACHRANGTGFGSAFPALAGNPVLQTKDATSAIHIVLSGGAQPATQGAPSALTMAPYAELLSDQQVADVVSYIQTAWGNQGGSATAADVAKIRKDATPVSAQGWTPQPDLHHARPGQDTHGTNLTGKQ
ncbi:cytochrome c [Robbsia sp. KACC 23696]|uniref:c-type cytochrome n=1 Tax=Robbsia sp. KACC 23696 TaxID=3149231 RepID=UPI00325B1878